MKTSDKLMADMLHAYTRLLTDWLAANSDSNLVQRLQKCPVSYVSQNEEENNIRKGFLCVLLSKWTGNRSTYGLENIKHVKLQ